MADILKIINVSLVLKQIHNLDETFLIQEALPQ